MNFKKWIKQAYGVEHDDHTTRFTMFNMEVAYEAGKQQNDWVSVKDDLPKKDVDCLVYKPNNKRCKFAIDKWIDLSKSPISWSRVVCTGEGWSNTEDTSKITHWKYLKGPEDK